MDQLYEQKDATLVYRSVLEAAEELDKDEALELLLSFIHLGLGDEVNLDECSKVVRLILKQNVASLIASDNRHKNAVENGKKGKDSGIKGKEHGSKGGRPRKGETKEEAYERRNPPKTPQETPVPPLNTTIENPPRTPLKEEVEEYAEVSKEKDIYTEVSKEEYSYEEGNEIGNTLGKGIGKIMTTNTDTTDTSNTTENKLYKEEEMRVIPIEEKESYTDERFRNVVMVLEEKKPCSTEELKDIYINSFGELLNNYPGLNYSLLRTNNIDSFYECYQDIVNELIMKINLKSQRDCSKEDVLETLEDYLEYIQYSYQ